MLPLVKVKGKKAGICNGVPSTAALVFFKECMFNCICFRFRDTFLSLGGGIHAGEVFRMFRGRDPSLDALPKRYGLIKMK